MGCRAACAALLHESCAKVRCGTLRARTLLAPLMPDAPVNLTYFDERTEKYRIKSRYKWSCWCLFAGILIGFVLAQLFQ